MTPVLPGSTLCDHSPAVVQPQEGCTAVNTSTASPVLVKINSCLTGSPALTLPKSYTGVSKTILGTAALFVAASAAAGTAGVCSAPRTAVPSAARHNVKLILFIMVLIFIM